MFRVQAPMPVAGLPSRLGGYRIIGHLGRKAAPNLLVATDFDAARSDKLYVLKVLPSEDFDNVEAVAMLVSQARTMTLLHHPHIVRTYDVVVDEALTFVVREYLDGQSLENILAVHEQPGARSLGLDMRLRLVCDVLDGLHYAHELRGSTGMPLNIVHGDVSPHNIFVTYEGVAKLLDFGSTETVTMSSPTRVDTVRGKVAYMAPEQVGSSEGPTRASDIFQIGLLLWEGAVGHRAWQGMDDYEILLRLNSKYGTLFVPPTGADSDLVTICQRATAVSPEERYPTALHFKNDVAAFMARRGLSVKADAIGRYVTDHFELQRRELRQRIRARLKSDELDELAPLVSSDTVVEAATVVEPARVVQAATPADSGDFDARDTVVEPGTVVQAATPADSGAFDARDTVAEPGTVVQAAAPADSEGFDTRDTVIEPGTVSESGPASRAGNPVGDSGPASAFSASVVFHEPMYKPVREPVHQAPACPPAPEPAPAESSSAAVVEPQPAAPSIAQGDEIAAIPEKPRRPQVLLILIAAAAGLLVVLAGVLASRLLREDPSKPMKSSPPPSATVLAPPVAPPTAPRATTAPSRVGHEPTRAPGVEHEPEQANQPAAVVPAEESSSLKTPALHPKPSGTSSKVTASKRRVRWTKATASRRGKRAGGVAEKPRKAKRWP